MNAQQLQNLFSHLDAMARPRADGASARAHDRHRVRVACTIHFIAFDGSAVRTVGGITRDISRSGLGLLTKQSFPKEVPVRVCLTLPDKKIVDLTGTIAYDRLVRVGWHLIGIRFGPVNDRRLIPSNKPGRITEPRTKPPPRAKKGAPTSS